MSSIFDVLRKRKQERIESAGERYDRLVTQLVNSEAVSAEEVEQIVAAANRSADGLEKEVGRLCGRRRHAARMELEPALRQQLQGLEAELIEHQKAIQEAQRVFNEAFAAYGNRKREIEIQLKECNQAKHSLRQSASPELVNAIAEVGREISQQQERLSRLRDVALNSKGAYQRIEERWNSYRKIMNTTPAVFQGLERDADFARRNWEETQAAVKECEQQIIELQREQSELEPRLLDVE